MFSQCSRGSDYYHDQVRGRGYDKKRKGRTSASSTIVDLKPPYAFEVVATPYPAEYKVPMFQKFDGQKDNTK